MIAVTGVSGVAMWSLRTRRNAVARLICLNDGFSINLDRQTGTAQRAAVIAMVQHSEVLNGRTTAIATVDELGQ